MKLARPGVLLVTILVVTAGTVVASPVVPLGDTDATSTADGDALAVQEHENESFEVTNVSIPETVETGASLTVTANVTNPNDAPRIQPVELRVDGDLVEQRMWALNPNETEEITFTVSASNLTEGTSFVSVLTRTNGSVAQVQVGEGTDGDGTDGASVSVADQSSDGTSLTVADVSNDTAPYYVAVWTMDENMEPDTLLGFQQVTETDASDVDVAFTEGNVTESQRLIVAVHPDVDGDASTADDPDAETILASASAAVTVEEETDTASVTFEDQTSDGSSVVVESAQRDMAPYFVAVWSVDDTSGDAQPETLLGVEEVVGTSADNLTVTLTEGTLNESATLVAAVHPPSGLGNATDDEPDTETILASDTANVTLEDAEAPGNGTDGNETGENATVTFGEASSDGTTLTVESVNMSEGGFVAIHDDTLLEGNVIGSVVGVSEYLEAGSHENVTITLFDVPGAEFNETELDDSQTLIAMPHLDTNDNETYDFVSTEGGEDGPYVDDAGDPVVDTTTVTVDGNDTNESSVVLP